MTVEELKQAIRLDGLSFDGGIRRLQQFTEGLAEATELLEEVEQYRALGTVEELKEALEKQVAKKPNSKEKPYSEDLGLNGELYCPTCNSYVGYFTEGMSKPEQMEYCNECGQHIAIDWEEGGTSD